MSPAIEYRHCHQRFETSQREDASPQEMAEIINKAAYHVATEFGKAIGSLYGSKEEFHSVITSLLYEPVSGETQYGIDPHTHQAQLIR